VEWLSYGAAVAAAICYGIANVLQARGVREVERAEGVDPKLLVRVTHSTTFLIGAAVDFLGFVFQLIALRALPLFQVQATVTSNLAVAALLATILLGERLGPPEWSAVAAVCIGLSLLAISAGAEGDNVAPHGLYFFLALALAGLAVLAMAARFLPGRTKAAWLGAAAGLALGTVALSARTLPDFGFALLTTPATYCVIFGGALGFLLFATALQGGAVTTATSAMVVGETVIPATVGVLVLGDRARPGLTWLAAIGFVLAVAGAVTLSRFGEAKQRPATP
jgi:drug/metabolite transporter (DMT)-like permease